MYPLFLISNMDFNYIDFNYLFQFQKSILEISEKHSLLVINLNKFLEVVLLNLLLPTESPHQYQYHSYILPKLFKSAF